MLVERVANLERQIFEKKIEEVQVPNDIQVISQNFFILKFPNHICFTVNQS